MDVDTLKPATLQQILSTFSTPLTRRITDDLRGYQLGPEDPLTLIDKDGRVTLADTEQLISYWGGDLLPPSDPRYPKQVQALRKSFTFRNVTLECVEMLADGVGADEPDWGWTVTRPLEEDEKPTEDEQALIAELESIMTSWWDRRNLPDLFQQVLISAIAHGRQPLRPRIPDRFRDANGRLKQAAPERSLDGLWFTLPDVADSGIYADPDTLQDCGLTRVSIVQPDGTFRDAWELTYLDGDGRTVIRSLTPNGTELDSANTDPLDLGEQLWLLELKFSRAAVTRDVISNQDALNVGLTNLSRNTRWAGFEKTIMLGVDPPVDEQGRVKPLSGPGAESYLQPSISREIETREERGQIVEVVHERMYPGASVTKLDPAEPKAIQASIDQAITNLYSILRQRFMLMDDQATASGRSREVATGAYLRATARYSTATEALIRNVLTLAAKVSALVQGQPGRYDALRPVVTRRQKVFELSSETITAYQALQKDGVISMQTLRAVVGVADPDAEQQLIEHEAATTLSRVSEGTGVPGSTQP